MTRATSTAEQALAHAVASFRRTLDELLRPFEKRGDFAVAMRWDASNSFLIPKAYDAFPLVGHTVHRAYPSCFSWLLWVAIASTSICSHFSLMPRLRQL